MKYKFLKYFLIFTIPFLTYLSFTGTGIITYSPIIEAFVLIPFLEFFLKPNDKNLSEAEEEMIKDDKMYDYILYLSIPIVYLLLYIFLSSMQDQTLSFYDRLGRVLSMGLICGSFGINIGHELGHRNNIFEQTLSKILLLSSLYMHFFIEHNRGHHKKVSTRDDPSSARYGEMIFIFWIRSIITGYISAWKLELKKLKRSNKNILSIHNEMLLFQLIQILFLLIIIYFFGFQITGYYLITALLGALVLETVNYIEHYGLERKLNINGKHERIMPYHSWNSNHPIGRIMLFELSRHSDHHFNSLRKYQILKNHKNSPVMPTGYPGMMILSLFPPLWFYVMNKKIRSFIS
jgi:alkane 1-monooxygenase